MRRLGRALLIVLVIAFALAQFVPVERTNPPVNAADTVEARLDVPTPVKAILDRSCRDCHTNQTVWPAYGYVAPASWLLAHDVKEGRENMNLSEWGQYDSDSARDILIEICRQVRRGDMPAKPYTLLHRSAALSAADVETLCGWTVEARKALPPE
jgi:Haem-binding domain